MTSLAEPLVLWMYLLCRTELSSTRCLIPSLGLVSDERLTTGPVSSLVTDCVKAFEIQEKRYERITTS